MFGRNRNPNRDVFASREQLEENKGANTHHEFTEEEAARLLDEDITHANRIDHILDIIDVGLEGVEEPGGQDD